MTKETFSKIISDSHEAGDFSSPHVERVGDPDDPNGMTIVRRELGDAAVTGIYSSDMKITNVNDSELIVHEDIDGNTIVVEDNGEGELKSTVIDAQDRIYDTPDNTPRPLYIDPKIPHAEKPEDNK